MGVTAVLLERMGETVTLERADGTAVEVPHVLFREGSISDQSVMDVQTRFINQARYKGDSVTLTVMWPRDAPHDLMDAHLLIRGERYTVYGDPVPITHPHARYDVRVTANRSLYLYEARLLKATEVVDEWASSDITWDGPTVRVNLLRLSESAETAAGARGMAEVVLLELEPGSVEDVGEYGAFEFAGHFHRIESVDRAGEQVVIGGTREVGDA